MFLLASLLIFYCLFNISGSQFDKTNEQKIAELYQCDPNCWFNETSIYSQTISFWPVNCTTVCGQINFHKNADVSIYQLSEYFKNLKILYGGISISFTKYINTDFFSSLEKCHCILGFDVSWNSVLEQLNFKNLSNITDCNPLISDNKLLDPNPFCEKYTEQSPVVASANLKNCKGCPGAKITAENLKNYTNCTEIIGSTAISDIFTTFGTDMSPLENVKLINGPLEAYYLDGEDLSFFKSLTTIKSNKRSDYDLYLWMSSNLKRLGIPNLTTLETNRDQFIIKLYYVDTNFCFTTREMNVFMRNNVRFEMPEVSFCENETIPNLCEFETLSALGTDCFEIFGDVVINSGDEIHVQKLNNVSSIYGSLTIQNTNLEDFKFLAKLEYIAQLNASITPFLVTGNMKLQSVKLPNFKRAYSQGVYQVSFNNNNPGILNSSTCLELMNGLKNTRVEFDTRECEVIDRANGTVINEDFRGNTCPINFCVLLVILIVFIIVVFNEYFNEL